MKFINTETLIQKEISIPTITGIYDPLSQKRDGTITPQAPIIVWGSNLNTLDLNCIRLCLIPALDCRLIEITHIYKYSSDMVIVSLPALKPGEYFPAVKLLKQDHEEEGVYIIPVSWIVKPSRYSAYSI